MPVIFLSGVQTLQGLWGIVEDCFQFPMISHSSKLVICYRRYVLFKFIIFFQLMSKELMPVIFLSGVQTLQRLWGIVEDCFQFPMISHSSKLVICYRRYVLFKFIIFFQLMSKELMPVIFLSGVQTLQRLWGIVEDCFQFPMISHSSKLVICYRRYVLFKFIIFFQLMSKELMPVIFLSGVQTLQELWGIVEDCFQFPMISHSSKLVICYRRYFQFILFHFLY